ncbi:MAG: F0F1 ATP synthase subunit gamma, partial [Rickettsiaceae bacterium]|nr:F0F1 ATP synthase subunit gamma [Rickettsiaceae bacterium]
MSGLKQLRNRVKSIKSTQKITRAMQVVSASKLQKVKEVAEDLNDYSTVLANIMYDISTHGNMSVLPMCDQRFFADALKQKPALLVVLTSERGLCGGFNATIIKKVKKDIKKLESENKEFKLIIVGKKGYNALKGEYSNDIAHYYNVYKDNYACIAKQVKDKIINMVE